MIYGVNDVVDKFNQWQHNLSFFPSHAENG